MDNQIAGLLADLGHLALVIAGWELGKWTSRSLTAPALWRRLSWRVRQSRERRGAAAD
jgi:hypothetical protein